MYKYYSTERPVSLETYPKPKDNKPINIHNFDIKTYIQEIKCEAYGYIEYEKPLTSKQVKAYELVISDKIICLAGESGSGKLTIAELLEKEGYNYIQSYTTRKPRFKNERGHIFVENEPLWLKERGLNYYGIIAYTKFDNNSYWATKEQYQGKGTSIYVIDPIGVKTLREKVKDTEIVVIYLKTEKWIRACRMWHREYDNSPCIWPQPHDWDDIGGEIKQRINNDRKAFKIVSCNYCIDANRKVDEVFKDVKSVIEER
jgi:guanylate kinase